MSVNPVLNFMDIVTLENRITLYRFDERVYDYESMLLVRDRPVWSPQLTVLYPWSKNFLFGALAAGNCEFGWDRYNAYSGPLLVFPNLMGSVTAVLSVSRWIRLTEGRDRYLALVMLKGNL